MDKVICFGNRHLLNDLEANGDRAYSEPDMVEQDFQHEHFICSVPEFDDHNSFLFRDRATYKKSNGKHDLPHSVDTVDSAIVYRHQHSSELEPAAAQPRQFYD